MVWSGLSVSSELGDFRQHIWVVRRTLPKKPQTLLTLDQTPANMQLIIDAGECHSPSGLYFPISKMDIIILRFSMKHFHIHKPWFINFKNLTTLKSRTFVHKSYQIEMFLWDISPPSWSAGFPYKVTISWPNKTNKRYHTTSTRATNGEVLWYIMNKEFIPWI